MVKILSGEIYMKRSKFFLLITLVVAFLLTLSVGVTVFAESGEGESSDSTSTLYTEMFTGGGQVEADNGIKITVPQGESVGYKYKFEIGDGAFVMAIPQEEIELEDGIPTTMFALIFKSNTESDFIYFGTDGEKVYVSLNEFDSENLQNELVDYSDIVISYAEGSVYYGQTELGKSALTTDYASFQIDAYLDSVVYVKSVNGLDFTTDLGKADSTPVIIVEDGFLTREKAIWGVEYTVDYVAFDSLSSVENTLSIKRIFDEIGEDVDEEEIVCDSNYKLTFTNVGKYVVKIESKNGGDVKKVYEKQILVEKATSSDSVYYDFTEDDLTKINGEIVENIYDAETGKYIALGSTFNAPSVNDILVSDYFDSEYISKTLYYACRTTSSDFVSSTSLSFSLKEPGKYTYFILGVDEFGSGYVYNDEFKSNYELKEDGWHDVLSGELVIPSFTFVIENNAKPEVTTASQKVGIIGESYKVSTITIVNKDEINTTTEEYNLYFMSEENAKAFTKEWGFEFNKDNYASDADYIAALNELIDENKIVEINKDAAEKWDDDALTFTPQAKGNYYVKCRVSSSNGNNETVLTYAIKVSKEKKSATYEKEFFKYNKTSFIYLGISVVSFIGILLVLFIKPKKKDTSDEI